MVQYSNNDNKILDIHRIIYEKRYKVPKTIQRGRACSSASSTYSSDSIITYNKLYKSYNLLIEHCYIIN